MKHIALLLSLVISFNALKWYRTNFTLEKQNQNLLCFTGAIRSFPDINNMIFDNIVRPYAEFGSLDILFVIPKISHVERTNTTSIFKKWKKLLQNLRDVSFVVVNKSITKHFSCLYENVSPSANFPEALSPEVTCTIYNLCKGP